MCTILGWIGWINAQHINSLITSPYRHAQFLVEFVELIYNSYRYSIWYHIAVLELGSGDDGWISFRSFKDFREIDIFAIICGLFSVELVDLIINTYIQSFWHYLVF